MKSDPVVPDMRLPCHPLRDCGSRARGQGGAVWPHLYLNLPLPFGPTLLWIVSIWLWWLLCYAVLYINGMCTLLGRGQHSTSLRTTLYHRVFLQRGAAVLLIPHQQIQVSSICSGWHLPCLTLCLGDSRAPALLWHPMECLSFPLCLQDLQRSRIDGEVTLSCSQAHSTVGPSHLVGLDYFGKLHTKESINQGERETNISSGDYNSHKWFF